MLGVYDSGSLLFLWGLIHTLCAPDLATVSLDTPDSSYSSILIRFDAISNGSTASCLFGLFGSQVLDKSIIQRQNMGAQVKREISIMKLVRHPYVVQLREVLASSSKIFLVCELITGGELFDKIVEKQVGDEKL